jgi:hypothetical protein
MNSTQALKAPMSIILLILSLLFTKNDSDTGEVEMWGGYLGFDEELSWRTYISPRNIVFQANRIFFVGSCYLFCLIDESL